jgi:hypothetical protein
MIHGHSNVKNFKCLDQVVFQFDKLKSNAKYVSLKFTKWLNYSEKTRPSATLLITNCMQIGLEVNTSLHCDRPVTNCLSHGKVFSMCQNSYMHNMQVIPGCGTVRAPYICEIRNRQPTAFVAINSDKKNPR